MSRLPEWVKVFVPVAVMIATASLAMYVKLNVIEVLQATHGDRLTRIEKTLDNMSSNGVSIR